MEWKWNSMIAASSVLVHCRYLQVSARKSTCYSVSVVTTDIGMLRTTRQNLFSDEYICR
jgi:hypothetical protein